MDEKVAAYVPDMLAKIEYKMTGIFSCGRKKRNAFAKQTLTKSQMAATALALELYCTACWVLDVPMPLEAAGLDVFTLAVIAQ